MELVVPDIGLIFWQTVTFLVVLFLLRRYAWSPIVNGLKARESSIEEALGKANAARQEIEQLKGENEKLLQEARLEREKILNDALGVAENIKEQAKQEAARITEKMIEDARVSINTEKQAALTEVRNQVANLSLQIAEKLLRRNLSNQKSQQDLVEEFIKDLKVN
ncbi:MAG: F0F1 ATP synthase subunit B [Candidatus Cyclobacteriaceae bacterium M3_2C_046]